MFTLSTVIGYYVHHQGRGHLHRAVAIAARTGTTITGLSTHSRPAGWSGEWLELADDAGAGPETRPDAGGRLHYVPYAHEGLRSRMAALSAWIADTRPDALVVDVSVEVALLARLHGVPVLTLAQPGRRRDSAHTLGYSVSEQILAPWPKAAGPIWQADPTATTGKVTHLGAISRFGRADRARRADPRQRAGAQRRRRRCADRAGRAGPGGHPDWDWAHLGPGGAWLDDPWPLLTTAAVVVSHCGQNAVAEIAAARRPAVLVPQPRPFGEQAAMAAALRHVGVPAIVLDAWPAPPQWPALLRRAAALDGAGWSTWNDGSGPVRAAQTLEAAAQQPSDGVRTALITTVHGRHAHLRAQQDAIGRMDPGPTVRVVVAMDDPDVGRHRRRCDRRRPAHRPARASPGRRPQCRRGCGAGRRRRAVGVPRRRLPARPSAALSLRDTRPGRVRPRCSADPWPTCRPHRRAATTRTGSRPTPSMPPGPPHRRAPSSPAVTTGCSGRCPSPSRQRAGSGSAGSVPSTPATAVRTPTSPCSPSAPVWA